MAQVTGHEVLGNGDHELTFDDGTTQVLAANKVSRGASWGQVLTALGGHVGTPKPSEK